MRHNIPNNVEGEIARDDGCNGPALRFTDQCNGDNEARAHQNLGGHNSNVRQQAMRDAGSKQDDGKATRYQGEPRNQEQNQVDQNLGGGVFAIGNRQAHHEGERFLLPLSNHRRDGEMRADGNDYGDEQKQANVKRSFASGHDDAQTGDSGCDRDDNRPALEIPILQHETLDHGVVHTICLSLLLCTLATKISSSFMLSTACTVAPTSWQAETIADSKLFVVSTGNRSLPPTWTIPGSFGNVASGGSTRRKRRQRSRKFSLSAESMIRPRSMNVIW